MQFEVEALARIMADANEASEQMQQDLKYPPYGDGVFLLQYVHPDIIPVVVGHLIKCGWRKDPEKAIHKARPVIGSAFQDLVAWVPIDAPDEPIRAPQREQEPLWSVKPNVTVLEEKRPDD